MDVPITVQSRFSIMLALCLMLLATYYAQNYAGIINWSLVFRAHDMHMPSKHYSSHFYTLALTKIIAI